MRKEGVAALPGALWWGWQALRVQLCHLPPGAISGPNPTLEALFSFLLRGVWSQAPLDWEPRGQALFLLVFEVRALFRAWGYSRCPIKVCSVRLCAQHTLSVQSSSRQPCPSPIVGFGEVAWLWEEGSVVQNRGSD